MTGVNRTPLTAGQVTEHAVNQELKPHLSDVLTEREGFCFQSLGIDSENRVVFYASDDGHVVRYRYLSDEHELKQDASTFLGRELDSEPERVDPFLTAFVYLTERGENWTWIHPRFRWARDELTKLKD